MSFQIPAPLVDRMLDLLGSDDVFRQQFTESPRRALAALGFAPAADEATDAGIWLCLKTGTLAPKETIRASRMALRIQLLDKPGFNPFVLGMAGPDFQPSARRIEVTTT